MIESFEKFASTNTSHLSIGSLIASIFAGLVFLIIFIVCARLSHNLVVNTGKVSFTVLKIVLIALAPGILMILAFFHVELPVTYFIIATVVVCIGVLVWNIVSFGLLGGLLLSFVHIVSGIIAGLSAAGLVIAAIAGVLLAIFGGGTIGGVGGSASDTPHSVRNVSTNELYHVQSMNGTMYIPSLGNRIIRPSDYVGRYIDDYGNDYISC